MKGSSSWLSWKRVVVIDAVAASTIVALFIAGLLYLISSKYNYSRKEEATAQ